MATASGRKSSVHLTKNWMSVGCAPALFARLFSSSRDHGDCGLVSPKYGASGFMNSARSGMVGAVGEALADGVARGAAAGAGIGPLNATATTHRVMPASSAPLTTIQTRARRLLNNWCLDTDHHCAGQHRPSQ